MASHLEIQLLSSASHTFTSELGKTGLAQGRINQVRSGRRSFSPNMVLPPISALTSSEAATHTGSQRRQHNAAQHARIKLKPSASLKDNGDYSPEDTGEAWVI